jgi:hypothetical protein
MAKGTGTELMGEATELMSGGTELMGNQADSGFTGGFLQIGETLEGWEITGRLDVCSLEAEEYRAKKGGKESIVKYYRGITNLKTDILKKIQGLNHEDIVNLYQFGLYEGRLFEIMEYAAGGGLDSRNEDGSYKYLPLTEEELIGVCKEMINAFDKCHSMGIIHRDIKPGNVFYRECSPEPDENGKRLDSTFVMRLSIEGFAADNLLQTKPLLSERLQRLIRGLLLENPEHRWGYKEVKDHLDGKEAPVWVEKKEFRFTIGDKDCTNLEELAEAILDKPEAAHKKIFDGQLKSVLKAKFPEKSKRIEEITEEASAKRDYFNHICKVAWSLSLTVPFKPGNGYEARGADDISNLIANAPETMLPLLKDKKSRLYAYLEVVDKKEEADEIRAIAITAGNAELISKAFVILCGRVITPYKLAKYRGFTLDTPENLVSQEIPGDLQNRILLLIKEKSCEGLVYPWIDLHLKEKGVNEYEPKMWDELIGLFGQKKAA